jgi:hypothetical protein
VGNCHLSAQFFPDREVTNARSLHPPTFPVSLQKSSL